MEFFRSARTTSKSLEMFEKMCRLPRVWWGGGGWPEAMAFGGTLLGSLPGASPRTGPRAQQARRLADPTWELRKRLPSPSAFVGNVFMPVLPEHRTSPFLLGAHVPAPVHLEENSQTAEDYPGLHSAVRRQKGSGFLSRIPSLLKRWLTPSLSFSSQVRSPPGTAHD